MIRAYTLDSEAQSPPFRSHSNSAQPPPLRIKSGWSQRLTRSSRPPLSTHLPHAAPPPGARHPAPGPWLGAVPGSLRRPGFKHNPWDGSQKAPLRAAAGPQCSKSRRASHVRPRAREGVPAKGNLRPPGFSLPPRCSPHRPGAPLLSPGLHKIPLPRPLVGQA